MRQHSERVRTTGTRTSLVALVVGLAAVLSSAGNVDSAYAATAAPTVTSGPTTGTTSTTATFTYADTATGASFTCALDSSTYAACATTGATYTGLASGNHSFKVKATVGTATSAATTYAWTIAPLAPPAPTITSQPASPTSATTAAFKYSDTQSGVTYGCSLDGAAYATCAASGVSYTGLALGTHAFGVEAKTATSAYSIPTTASWVVGPGPAAKLAVSTQPSTTAINGVALVVQPVVTVQDAKGNTINGTGPAVTLAVASGSGTLACTTNPVTASSGVAAFVGCSITGTAGAFTLVATATGLTSVTTSAITLTPGAATKLAVTTPAAGAANTVAFTTQPVIAVQDSGGNTVTTSSAAVTLALTSGTGTLVCTTNPVTAVSGVAAVSGCSITGTAGAFTLMASANGLTSATSPLTMTAGPVAGLVLTSQPTGATNGVAFSTQPVADVVDASGNRVTTSTAVVTLSITSGAGTLACTANPVSAVSGTAKFTGCKITGLVGSYTLSVSNGGLAHAATSAFTLAPGAGARLAFSTQPDGATNGAVLTTQPAVTVLDASGNVASSSVASITLTASGGTFTCTTDPSAAISGVATFAGCALTGIIGVYTLSAKATGLTSATSSSLVLSPGVATRLVVTAQPGGATNSTAFTSQPTVTVQDSSGNTVTMSTAMITLVVSSGNGTLACAANPLHAVSGIATFTDCSITGATGSYTLTASSSPLSSVTTVSFVLSPGAPTKFAVTTQPAGAFTGIAFTTQPKFTVQDASGNTVPTATGPVTLAIVSGTGTLSLCTANPVIPVSGVVTFAGCAVTGPAGVLTLSASATGLTTATTASFTLAVPPMPTITSSPTSSTTSTTAAFKYSSTMSGIANVCSLDGAAYVTCGAKAQSYTGLAFGAHTFAVKSSFKTSSFGLPATFSWTIVTFATAIAATTGTPQFVVTGNTFGTTLTAKVTGAGGAAVGSSKVTFTAPSTGPSGTFATCSGGNPTPYTCVVLSAVSGIATASALTANSTPGSFTVTAAAEGVAIPATYALIGSANFTMSGGTTGLLVPGAARGIDVSITNPNPSPITVSSVSVMVSSDSAGCPAATNFAVVHGLNSSVTVPGNSTKSLSELSVAPANWPTVSMLNTNINQDACKGAKLTFAFAGTAAG